MKNIIIAATFLFFAASCTKQCFKCSIESVNYNGQVTGTKTEKYCIEKTGSQYESINNNPDCKATI